MNYKILTITYSIFLSILAVASIAISWANDPKGIFILEMIVDICFLLGCFLSLSSKIIKWWIACIVFVVLGEIYLLVTYPNFDFFNMVFWVGVLSPALFLNLKVSGVIIKQV